MPYVGQVTETRGGLGYGFTRRLVLNNDEIIALPSGVLILVPAVPNRAIFPQYFYLRLDPWFADYTGEIEPLVFVDTPAGGWSTTGVWNTGVSVSCLSSGAAATSVVYGPGGTGLYDTSPLDADVYDQPMGLVVNGTDGMNFGGGDARNVLTITINYLLIP
jgi:hypothetical protein